MTEPTNSDRATWMSWRDCRPPVIRHCECGCGRQLAPLATRYRVARRCIWRAASYRCAQRIAGRLDRPPFQPVALGVFTLRPVDR